MLERFLPIGSVVLLKGGKKEVMITSYCIIPNGPVVNAKDIKDGQIDNKLLKPQTNKEMFEYGGCLYPEGILDSNMVCAFNHEQIEKVLFVGYVSDTQKELSSALNAGYEAYKEERKKTTDVNKGTN